MDFSLKEIIEILRKRLWLIVIITLIALGIFFGTSKFIISPSYTATVQLYVNTNDSTSSANLNDLNYAQKVSTTYINFLQTKVFYKQVIEETNQNYTPEQLKKMTLIQSVNNTEIFQISVTTHNPNVSYEIVKTMQEIAPKLIRSIKGTAEISVVDPVQLPTLPSSPNNLLNTLIGGVLGVILSVLAIFVWEIIDVRVKSQEELVKKYQLPILGKIPKFESNKQNNQFPRNRFSAIRYKKENLFDNKNNFIITEAYKELRTNLRFILRNNLCKKIIINSPIPEDGKSTTSTNLALTIAQTGVKVLLMDCDLRKGKLHNFFNLKSTPGISNVLSGTVEFSDVIQKTSNDNLQVMTLGSIPPNPTELLASTQMENLISKLEKLYDYIIIDTPPINVVADALSLVKMVDGVVIVVREGVTTHPNISSAIVKYEFVEADIMGFVLNGASFDQGKRARAHYYYYKGN